MKKLFELILYLFYRYYYKGSTKVIAYESALIAVSALIFLNVFAILNLVKIDSSWIAIIEQNYSKTVKLIFGLFLVLPQYFILYFTIKRENVIHLNIDLKKVKKWNFYLISYILFSILFMIFSVKVKMVID